MAKNYDVLLLGSGASIEEIERAYSAPASELPILSEEEVARAKVARVPLDEYRRSVLAERYHSNYIRKVIDKVVAFLQEEILSRGGKCKVSRVIWEPSRDPLGFFVFRIFFQVNGQNFALLVSYEDAEDYADSQDAVAARNIRDSISKILDDGRTESR
ncbi:MAG: hypothetical protein LAO21_21585 [Acidobacteriia bacterium]|nr:hypothetical protein [Terriglobia bacterium]